VTTAGSLAHDDLLAAIVAGVAARFSRNDGEPKTFLSFGRMASPFTFPMEVEIRQIANVINAVSDEAVTSRIVDPQVWVQERCSKNKAGLRKAYGCIIDVDGRKASPLSTIEQTGTLTPTACWATPDGGKFAYAGVSPVAPDQLSECCKRLTLSFEGGDPASWKPSQGQRLPKCLRQTDSGILLVDFAAHLSNGVPFIADPKAIPFPDRILRALGTTFVTSEERQHVADYLATLGIPVPDSPGDHALYDVCPAGGAKHDARCTYVNRRDDGAIDVICLGGHGGAGRKRWTEADLLVLAEEDHEM